MNTNYGLQTKAFLLLISLPAKKAILDTIAQDYGVSTEEIEKELYRDDAHQLLEYMKEPHRSATRALMKRFAFVR